MNLSLQTNGWPHLSDIQGVSDHQRATIAKCFTGQVGILAGTPGTGKTYSAGAIIKAIVESVGEAIDESSIGICAPTGKAAVRCTSAMQGYDIDLEATTVHRMLQVQGNGHVDGDWNFFYNRDNYLPYQYIVIDEGSMLGTNLARDLFSAIDPEARVLLIGDPYQLPPVDHGAPLRDFIAAGLPYGELTEIRRNSGAIVEACREIKNGRGYRPQRIIQGSSQPKPNLRHIETYSPKQSFDAICRLIDNAPPGVDKVWDIQILVPLNSKSELSRKKLNAHLQEMLNPNGARVAKEAGGVHRFRVNDKVICLSNCMLPLVDSPELSAVRSIATREPTELDRKTSVFTDDEPSDPEIKEFVANGEIGRVTRVEPRFMHVQFDSPSRKVLVPFGGKSSSDDGDSDSDSDDADDQDSAKGSAGSKFDLAYAITVHKAQGSQAKVVIVVSDETGGARQVCCREWWYTAISRAEKLCFTVGSLQTINHDCQRVALVNRKTFLRELITGEIAI